VADKNKFGMIPDANPGKTPGALRCEEWEALLVDSLDGLLPPSQSVAFHAHSDACVSCSGLLAHARQGQEWLGYLHAEPEIPAGLVGKIVEKTAGAGAIPVPVLAGAAPGVGAVAVPVPWHRSFHETRLLMTVAMAFFSSALILNMAGVRFTNLRLADLRPSTIGNTLSRQFYGAREQVAKFYANARFMYQLESKMRELRRDTDAQQQPAAPKKQPSSKNEKDGRLNPPPARGEVLDAAHTDALRPPLRAPAAESNSHPINARTEAKLLDPLGAYRAGPRQISQSAGNERRSLA
jgi:hypothetical protein